MQRINSVKLHTLTSGSLCYTHTHTLEHFLHTVSQLQICHMCILPALLYHSVSDSFIQRYFLIHFLSVVLCLEWHNMHILYP